MTNEKGHLHRFFILTPRFREHLYSVTTLNMPLWESLISEKRNLANLPKKNLKFYVLQLPVIEIMFMPTRPRLAKNSIRIIRSSLPGCGDECTHQVSEKFNLNAWASRINSNKLSLLTILLRETDSTLPGNMKSSGPPESGKRKWCKRCSSFVRFTTLLHRYL